MTVLRENQKISLRMLKAFETVARHLSMTKAAEELQVTPPALTHHIRSLSLELGDDLLVKVGSRLQLTPKGRRLAVRLQGAFSEIDRTLEEIDVPESTIIKLEVCSAFAPGWLIKRMKTLAPYAHIFQLELSMSTLRAERSVQTFDGIITPLEVPVGYHSIALKEEHLVAVHSSSVDPATVPLITMTAKEGSDAPSWHSFVDSADQINDLLGHGSLVVSHYILAKDMAEQGLGTALIPDFLAEDGLMRGSLRLLTDEKVPTGRTYKVCVKSSRRYEPAITAFVQWIGQFSDVETDAQELSITRKPKTLLRVV